MKNTSAATEWNQISDPNRTQYREHESLGHWESTDGTERIEHQRSEYGEGYYRYAVDADDNGTSYGTLAEAQNA